MAAMCVPLYRVVIRVSVALAGSSGFPCSNVFGGGRKTLLMRMITVD